MKGFKEEDLIKFMFSKKATKIEKIFTVDLTFTIVSVNFCGLLRKHELYKSAKKEIPKNKHHLYSAYL